MLQIFGRRMFIFAIIYGAFLRVGSVVAEENIKGGIILNQGSQMREEIIARCHTLISERKLREKNDISDIVGKFLRKGMSFSEAEKILTGAGLMLAKRPVGNTMGLMDPASIVASSDISPLPTSGRGIQVILTPSLPGVIDGNEIDAISAIVFSVGI